MGASENESRFEPLWKLLEPIQSLGLILTGFPSNLHKLRREGEQLSAIQEQIDEGLITDKKEIQRFDEAKDEFLQRMEKAFSRE